jgi:hypothetical protein
MTAKFNLKIFSAFICLCLFASTTAAQDEKPQVMEFAEVGVKSDETELGKLTETLEGFISRLSKAPTTTEGFIDVPTNVELGRKIKSFVADAGMESRIRYLSDAKHPKYHHFAFIHFLIVPKGAEISPVYTEAPCLCTTLDIIAPEFVTEQDSVLTFKAKVGDDDIDGLSYEWFVSAGKIVEGQGTPTIKVDAEDANEVTATVQIGGFCENCNQTTSELTKINRKPQLIDEFGQETSGQIRYRLDILLQKLRDNPTAKGFIINYGSPTDQRFLKVRRAQIIEKFSYRPSELTSRIAVINGGYREEVATELWLSFDENQKPVPTPMIDKRFVETIKPISKTRPRK